MAHDIALVSRIFTTARISHYQISKVAERQGRPGDLRGLCARATLDLFKRLREQGMNASFAVGVNHAFAMVDDLIVDVTASQFANVEPVEGVWIADSTDPEMVEDPGVWRVTARFGTEEEILDAPIWDAWPAAERPSTIAAEMPKGLPMIPAVGGEIVFVRDRESKLWEATWRGIKMSIRQRGPTWIWSVRNGEQEWSGGVGSITPHSAINQIVDGFAQHRFGEACDLWQQAITGQDVRCGRGIVLVAGDPHWATTEEDWGRAYHALVERPALPPGSSRTAFDCVRDIVSVAWQSDKGWLCDVDPFLRNELANLGAREPRLLGPPVPLAPDPGPASVIRTRPRRGDFR